MRLYKGVESGCLWQFERYAKDAAKMVEELNLEADHLDIALKLVLYRLAGVTSDNFHHCTCMMKDSEEINETFSILDRLAEAFGMAGFFFQHRSKVKAAHEKGVEYCFEISVGVRLLINALVKEAIEGSDKDLVAIVVRRQASTEDDRSGVQSRMWFDFKVPPHK